MRELGKNERNKLVIRDSRSGSDIELYYRNPTTEEEVQHQAKLFRRKGKKLFVNYGIRIDSAIAILTGFGPGAFALSGREISADEKAENYYPSWKELVKESAPDLLMLLAVAVFEGSRVTGAEDEEEFGGLEVEAEDGIIPFPKS